jgi:hypothetical protein
MKTCIKCKNTFDFSYFYKRNNHYVTYSSACKECVKAERKENHKPLDKKNYDLIRAYNITINDFKKMFDEQEGKCKICSKSIKFMSEDKTKSACVDHCHTTNKVRGLLCHSCNRALGLFQDNKNNLEKAIQYLNES